MYMLVDRDIKAYVVDPNHARVITVIAVAAFKFIMEDHAVHACGEGKEAEPEIVFLIVTR